MMEISVKFSEERGSPPRRVSEEMRLDMALANRLICQGHEMCDQLLPGLAFQEFWMSYTCFGQSRTA